ncbi:TetR family transcriptional regulator C-terminal domain-containing protein [Rhodococcus sp. MTM3W5.2]|uniref:TetR family transcriptional regulator C-terminal domain-containing protein n=1 Tax=Rhodococcus sp. MTM3W5.2 TaxID=1805827 RepID=UPI001CB8A274|nr:TetR family transcriptional regulator C-terminal domain-containing protein [Rhodococcus sp. MTM3W5.2]
MDRPAHSTRTHASAGDPGHHRRSGEQHCLGELRASAVFSDDLREPLRATTQAWAHDAETLIRRAQTAGRADPEANPADAAERLTSLVEGLSERWLSGSMALDRARELLAGAIIVELGPI